MFELTYEELLEVLEEAKDKGEPCEVFFLDEFPEIEGYVTTLKEEQGYKIAFDKSCGGSWVVHF